MDNVYKAPEAELLVQQDSRFFVTSIRKLVILFVCTLGAYSLYWSYKQWASQRSQMAENIWPSLRAFFAIFFMHSLSRRMNDSLAAEHPGEPRDNDAATWFVVLTVAGAVLSRGSNYMDLPLPVVVLIDLLPMLTLFPLITLQRRANLISQNPDGQRNHSLTLFNWPFILLGLVLWTALLWAYSTGI